MRNSILSRLRENPKIVKVLVFLTSWTQLHAYANTAYLNKPKETLPGADFHYSTIVQNNSSFLKNNEKSSAIDTALRNNISYSNEKNIDSENIYSPSGNGNKTLIKGQKTIINQPVSGFYISDIKEGIIGKDSEHPIDQIYDNIFNVTVNEKIRSDKQYSLEYDLYGLKDYKQVSKVINDELAVGGQNVEKTTVWAHQTEPVKATSVKEGKNIIIFTIPNSSDYSYKIRNLRIVASDKKSAPAEFANSYVGQTNYKYINSQNQEEELSLNSATLKIEGNSVKNTAVYSITALRDIDMPALTPEMVNVTADHFGYRFLPHGENFSAAAKVSIGYDKSKIPTGYTEQDIKTFYFDLTQKKWIPLEKAERDSLQKGSNIIVSKTTHFTDMVNGIIKVPESPETGSYAPNSIKDIKAANPTEGIVSIAPPAANNMGTVNTSFPIKLPAGRGGMQPSLSVNYSSEGGNGWLGLGWDLSIPSISIDTRWGVPTYDQTFETEIYTLGGEQLTFKVGDSYVLPNRNEGFEKNRSANLEPDNTKRFYPRIEGGYSKIIRHGNSPKEYWWEVISKDGTRSIFGNDGTANNPQQYYLKDSQENIGHWALYKTIDTNGNYVEYTYDKSIYGGNPGNGGQELHISEINYTLHNVQNPPKNYKVTFNTVSGREDVQINGRLGFLQIESKRLSSIEVKYGSEKIRSYGFTYRNDDSSFKKSLLESITEKDASDAIFYTNKMEYDKAPATLFGSPQPWIAPDNASFSGLTTALQGGYSLLNGSYSYSLGSHFRIGVGAYNPFDFVPLSDTSALSFNKGTFGAHFGFDKGFGETKITSLDIDGDNLPDRIYEQNDEIYYSKNLSAAVGGTSGFGLKVKIASLANIGKTTTNTWNVGVDGNFGSADIGFDYSNSTSVTKSYFMDFNNDGLIDFVKDGKVFFNRIVGGIPVFDEISTGTPYPIDIASGVQNSASLFDNEDEQEKKMMLKQNPLHDIVRVWVAPKTGTITVKNNFKLLASQYPNPYYDPSQPISTSNQQYLSCPYGEDCSKVDGVAVSFQYKNNDPIVQNINPGDYSLHSFADQNIAINKGERLYFRITSKYDGLQDQVSWNPEINYTTQNTPTVDSDNRNLSLYKSEEDFVNSNTNTFIAGKDGTLNIFLNKNIQLSDNAKIVYSINDIPNTFNISYDSVYNNSNIASLSINGNDKISIKVYTDTQIDWTNFRVTPEFTEVGSNKKAYLQTEYSMYNDRGGIETYTITSGDIGKSIYAKVSNFPTTGFNYEGAVTSSLKFVNQLLSKTIVTRKLVNNVYVNNTNYSSAYVIKSGDVGKTVYIENTINAKKDFANSLPVLTTSVYNYTGNYIDTPGTSTVQSLIYKTGSIFVGASNNNLLTLNVTLLSPDPNNIATAELNVYDNQGNLVYNLFADSSQTIFPSIPITQGIYTYELTVTNGGRGRITINNVGVSQLITTVAPVSHKSLFAPENISVVLASNQYDTRFGLLYRGWGGFIVNGNNYTKDNIVEAYDLLKNYANSGTVSEMKIDETKLALSQTYSQDPGTNPTINNPVDNNGNLDLSQLDNNSASLSNSGNYFFFLQSDINNEDKGRLTGTDQFIYLSKTILNSSRVGVHNIDENFKNQSLSIALGSKLNAPELKFKNQSVSGRGGLSFSGFNASASKSLFNENKAIRSLIDYNGDGFPDDFSRTKVQITNKLGYLSSDVRNSGSQTISKADVIGVSAGYSFKHADSKVTAWGIIPVPTFILLVVPVDKVIEGAKTVSLSGQIDVKNDQWSKQSFVDINGDGLPDKFTGGDFQQNSDGAFELNVGNLLVNNSSSWGTDETSTNKDQNIGGGIGFSLFKGSFEGGINTSTSTSKAQKELMDINGDGIVDNINYTDNGVLINFNKGNGFSGGTTASVNSIQSNIQSLNLGASIAYTGLILLTGVKITIGGGNSLGESSSKVKSTFKDMNGDGYPDFVTSDDTNSVTVRLNQIGTTNLLRKVTTPSGGSWEVEYERVGNTYDMPQSKYVLKTVTTNDGFTGDNAFSPDVSKVTIQYANPYHSRRERTFYGFEKVTVNQIDTKQGGISSNVIYRKTIQTFNNSNYYLKGNLLNEKLLDAGDKIWTEKNNTYELRKIHSPNTLNTLLNLEKESEKNHTDYACFVALKNTDSKFYEGLTTATKSTSSSITEYDEWGNAVKVTDFGDTQIGNTEIVSSEVTYGEVAPGKYVIAPKTVKNTATGIVREKRAVYNSLTGDLEKMVIKNQGADYSVYDFVYDDYGNITKSTGPANSANQRFFHQYTYDDNVKTYPVKVQDAFGYSSKTQYDFRFGVPTLTEDMNLQPMKYVYDAKARTTEITGPYEMFNNIPWTIKFEYNPITDAPLNATNAQSYAVTKHYDPEYQGTSTINTITIADGFGEAIQVKKTGDIYNDGVKYIVAGKVESDAFGRALKTYYPTTENVGSGNTLYNASVDTTEPTINQYDVLDRVVYTKLPGENLFSTIEYGFADDVQGRQMFATTFKDELGSIKKSYTDIKGRTTSVWEVSNTGDIKTKFTHDAIGQILKVEDVAGNITTSQYDDLGRRISYKHPDSGITTYKYDPAGNMNSKTNAANEIVNYKYDYTRLKEVNYPVYPENNVKYYYGAAMDASAMDNNAVGRLWYQTDATGTQYLKYGRLGELIYQRRSVAVPDAGVYWFGTSWEYDTWNRVKKITYPDGEEVKYTYNKAGNLFKMNSVKDGFSRDIIKNLGYDKFEQRVYLQYGNGTETTYEYETNRRRLLKMYAKNSNRYFMQNTYQYDVVSNVMQVHNNAPVVQGLLGGGTNYAYGYDDLYRLTSSSGNWRGINSAGEEERHRFTVGMTYDNMHNIMSKTQKHEWVTGPTSNNWAALEPTSYRLNYKYQDPSHPHAPSRIIDEPNLVPNATCCNPDDPGVKFQDYQYDPKGNPTKILQQTCTNQEEKAVYLWDEENRLRFVDTNPTTPEADGAAIYTYDAGGERIIKDVLFKGKIGKYNSNHIEVSGETIHEASIYPSGLITLNLTYDLQNGMLQEPRYTKHYYAGSQRIQSKNGNSGNVGAFDCAWLIIPFGGTTPPINPVNVSNQILQTATQSNLVIMQTNNLTPPINYGQNGGYTGNCVSSYASNVEEKEIYWFHPDHLGSSSFITGLDGEVTQNMEYFPSGEIFVENHMNDGLNSQYKFNGKEQDSETGYYYYGARYYNPRVSLWLNVDPLADYNPFYNDEHYIDGQHNGGVYNSGNLNPYIYCYQSPIRYIDPNGKQSDAIDQWAVNESLFNFSFGWIGDARAGALNIASRIAGKNVRFQGDGFIGYNKISKNQSNSLFGDMFDVTIGILTARYGISSNSILAIRSGTGTLRELRAAVKSIQGYKKYAKCIEFTTEFYNSFGGTAKQINMGNDVGLSVLLNKQDVGLATNGLHQFIEKTIEGKVYIFDNMNPEGVLKNDYIKGLGGYNRKTGQIYSGEQIMKSAKKIIPPKPLDPRFTS
ncbi:SpvB/TcaC N-terminal domain-containing protein [Chryseobacterium gambrini]|uniref:RHS repeat-associated core domain-containing protein n=1 Tax=Chryseobacterium gambrini TaxID=373672 RepID=A0A1N7LAE3_9FLAO|nr:SpvB/TcaC N-terminal domain-containing protein [Chryseobacterium gambrini]SIS70774.1 RHS repeat-associated core domain-containing protein [Chryseobacterium gambrini]